MEWTKEWPAGTGVYWIAYDVVGGLGYSIARFVAVPGVGTVYGLVGEDKYITRPRVYDWLFYGPIEPPPLPQPQQEREP